MHTKPSGKKRDTASAGESNGHTSCNTIPVAGKFPIRKPNQEAQVAETHDANRKPYDLPQRSRFIITCRPTRPKLKIRWVWCSSPDTGLRYSLSSWAKRGPVQLAGCASASASCMGPSLRSGWQIRDDKVDLGCRYWLTNQDSSPSGNSGLARALLTKQGMVDSHPFSGRELALLW